MAIYFIYLDLLRTLLYFIEMHVHSIVKIKSYSKLKIILYHIVNLPAVFSSQQNNLGLYYLFNLD